MKTGWKRRASGCEVHAPPHGGRVCALQGQRPTCHRSVSDQEEQRLGWRGVLSHRDARTPFRSAGPRCLPEAQRPVLMANVFEAHEIVIWSTAEPQGRHARLWLKTEEENRTGQQG